MKILTALAMLLTLSACSLPVFFRVPVVQGNIVTAKEVNRLKIGMNKRQVKYIMGTPLIQPSFEQYRWDYVFYYRDPRAHVRHSALKLYFSGNTLAMIGGDEQYKARSKAGIANGPLGNQPLPSEVSPGPNHQTTPGQVLPGSDNRPSPSDVVPGPTATSEQSPAQPNQPALPPGTIPGRRRNAPARQQPPAQPNPAPQPSDAIPGPGAPTAPNQPF